MSYLYPYGDTQQLNLSWFLAKFKELYEYISNLDPDDIALATVLSRFTNEYNSSTNYIPGDYTIHEGFIYKANQSTTGNFNPEAWDAALPVNDIQGLRILLGGLSTDLNTLKQNAVTNTQYTPGAATADGLLRQTKNGTAETVMTVDKEPTANSQNPVKSGAVYSKLDGLKGSLTSLEPKVTGANLATSFVQNEYVETNGAITPWTGSTHWDRTDYISVVGFEAVVVTCSFYSPYCAWYDSNKVYVSSFTVNDGENILTRPTNAAYLIISTIRASIGSLVVKRYGDDLNAKQTQISAYIENGEKASRTYKKYDYIVWKGALYYATTAIPQGTNLAIGTNLGEQTVGQSITWLTNRAYNFNNLVKILSEPLSKTVYEFNVERSNSGEYANFLFCGATGASEQFFYVGFINTAANGSTVTFVPLIAGKRTFTGSYNEQVLTITGNDTVWGGIRLIWLA